MQRSMVDLPAPDRPMTTQKSPALTETETSFRATVPLG